MCRQSVLPFIRGDGTGPDIWQASQRVFDARRAKGLRGNRKIAGSKVFARRSLQKQNSIMAARRHRPRLSRISGRSKGPLTTADGGGIRSLNVALRQLCWICTSAASVQYFQGVPSPVKHPRRWTWYFRENTEDIYAGIEYAGGTPEAQKLLDFIAQNFPKDLRKIRFGTKEAIAGFMKMASPDHDASHIPVQVGIA